MTSSGKWLAKLHLKDGMKHFRNLGTVDLQRYEDEYEDGFDDDVEDGFVDDDSTSEGEESERELEA